MHNISYRSLLKSSFLLMFFSLVLLTVPAQVKKPVPKPSTKGKKSEKVDSGKPMDVTPVDEKKVIELPKGPVRPNIDPFPFPKVPTSKSSGLDNAVERVLDKDRQPLEYEHIREDDVLYMERVWRDIDTREKMNLAFRYKGKDNNGSLELFTILMQAIRDTLITPYDPAVDDSFSEPLTTDKLISSLYGGDYLKPGRTEDLAKDPTGNVYKDTFFLKKLNFDSLIVKYRIKEEWIFDKESSRMYTRILGIAPLRLNRDPNTNEIINETPLFWVHYPSIRPMLALYDVYNGKNFSGRISWEELFELRYFASVIVKSTIDNPTDQPIEQYIKDSRLRLLESENIRNKIFNYELGLWNY